MSVALLRLRRRKRNRCQGCQECWRACCLFSALRVRRFQRTTGRIGAGPRRLALRRCLPCRPGGARRRTSRGRCPSRVWACRRRSSGASASTPRRRRVMGGGNQDGIRPSPRAWIPSPPARARSRPRRVSRAPLSRSWSKPSIGRRAGACGRTRLSRKVSCRPCTTSTTSPRPARSPTASGSTRGLARANWSPSMSPASRCGRNTWARTTDRSTSIGAMPARRCCSRIRSSCCATTRLRLTCSRSTSAPARCSGKSTSLPVSSPIARRLSSRGRPGPS